MTYLFRRLPWGDSIKTGLTTYPQILIGPINLKNTRTTVITFEYPGVMHYQIVKVLRRRDPVLESYIKSRAKDMYELFKEIVNVYIKYIDEYGKNGEKTRKNYIKRLIKNLEKRIDRLDSNYIAKLYEVLRRASGGRESEDISGVKLKEEFKKSLSNVKESVIKSSNTDIINAILHEIIRVEPHNRWFYLLLFLSYLIYSFINAKIVVFLHPAQYEIWKNEVMKVYGLSEAEANNYIHYNFEIYKYIADIIRGNSGLRPTVSWRHVYLLVTGIDRIRSCRDVILNSNNTSNTSECISDIVDESFKPKELNGLINILLDTSKTTISFLGSGGNLLSQSIDGPGCEFCYMFKDKRHVLGFFTLGYSYFFDSNNELDKSWREPKKASEIEVSLNSVYADSIVPQIIAQSVYEQLPPPVPEALGFTCEVTRRL